MTEKEGQNLEKKSHTVRSGDTIHGVAKRNNITPAELLKANPKIKNPNILAPKAILIIPGKKAVIDKAKEATAKIKKEISEKVWENKILANLEKGESLVTKLGTFDLRKRFIPGEKSNIQIIRRTFESYMKNSGKQFREGQKKYLLAYILATAKHETAEFTTLKEKTDGKKYDPPARVGKVLGNEL